MSDKQWWISVEQDTWAFSRLTSQLVNVSALPITGTMFTCACSCLISWTSIGRRLPTTQQISNDHRVDSANFTFTSYNVCESFTCFSCWLWSVFINNQSIHQIYTAPKIFKKSEVWVHSDHALKAESGIWDGSLDSGMTSGWLSLS